ncbi:unnamed protein product [Pieris brassicae]|uniref:Uncharacterized protein n=1 Tax=Pieris brassicae TaxID=7116 RepID=A0A9P0SG27_PIEBR|nr:unnamed protein product [Pieris brassicae]
MPQTLYMCLYTSVAPLLEFPVITVGGRGLGVVARIDRRTTAVTGARGYHRELQFFQVSRHPPVNLKSKCRRFVISGFEEQEINRKQFKWRNKFNVALPAVNWLRVAAPRRRRNRRIPSSRRPPALKLFLRARDSHRRPREPCWLVNILQDPSPFSN